MDALRLPPPDATAAVDHDDLDAAQASQAVRIDPGQVSELSIKLDRVWERLLQKRLNRVCFHPGPWPSMACALSSTTHSFRFRAMSLIAFMSAQRP